MKIYTKVLPIAALVVGFIIGISVNYPNVNNNEISGTIGKVNKYRDVQTSEADIQLRSELLDNEQLRQRYEDYYAMHYALTVEQSNNIDFVLETVKQNADFESKNEKAIKQLTQFRESLNGPRAALLLAHSAVKNVSKDNVTIVTEAINNANISITQIDYNDNAIMHFAEVLNDFIQSSEGSVPSDILKAHDLLTTNLLTKAILTNDKLMLKYLDEKRIYSDKEDLGIMFNSSELLKMFRFDTERLKLIMGQETFDLLVILNSNESLKLIFNDINKLESNLYDTEILNTGFKSQSDNTLGGVGGLLDTEKLNMFHDQDFLERSTNFDTELLKDIGIWNQEQLGFYNHEALHVW